MEILLYFSCILLCIPRMVSVWDKGQVPYGHPVDSESFSGKTLPHCSAAFVISRRAIMSVLFETLYSVPCYHLSILAPILHFLNYHNFVVVVVQSLSHVWLFVTLWTIAHQASLSMEFSRQEYWRGLPFPSPGHLIFPTQGSNLGLPHSGRFFTVWTTREAYRI